MGAVRISGGEKKENVCTDVDARAKEYRKQGNYSWIKNRCSDAQGYEKGSFGEDSRGRVGERRGEMYIPLAAWAKEYSWI